MTETLEELAGADPMILADWYEFEDNDPATAAACREMSDYRKEIYTRPAMVARNIRIMLKFHFPKVKFSVKSGDYGAIEVKWAVTRQDPGPALASDVSSILKQFEEGHFNGYTDSYDYSPTNWTRTFGGVKYVFCSNR